MSVLYGILNRAGANVCDRNLLNLRYIHIIPLTGTRLLPQLSPGGPQISGAVHRLYCPDVVFRFKFGVTPISQILISQGPEERVE